MLDSDSSEDLMLGSFGGIKGDLWIMNTS
jgi:hypothetical protein